MFIAGNSDTSSPFAHLHDFLSFSILFFFINSFFLLSCAYAEWVTPRRFHCRVNQAETPIHQTGMWLLSLHTGGMQWGKKRLVSWFFLQCLGCPPNLHTIPGPSYLPHWGLGWRGGQKPCRINTKSSNGAWGAETLHTATTFKDHHLGFRYLG